MAQTAPVLGGGLQPHVLVQRRRTDLVLGPVGLLARENVATAKGLQGVKGVIAVGASHVIPSTGAQKERRCTSTSTTNCKNHNNHRRRPPRSNERSGVSKENSKLSLHEQGWGLRVGAGCRGGCGFQG